MKNKLMTDVQMATNISCAHMTDFNASPNVVGRMSWMCRRATPYGTVGAKCVLEIAARYRREGEDSKRQIDLCADVQRTW